MDRILIEGVTPSEELIEAIRLESPTILLSFSCGKDSIATWLSAREKFERIVPYYLYLVPGLEFVEESLDYFERYFEQRIIRMPHPSLYRMLHNLVFQPPERCAIIEAANLPKFSYDDISRAVREDQGLAEDAFEANGLRASDSLSRRINFTRSGAINRRRRTFSPIWDWKKAEVWSAIDAAGIRHPVDYEMFGRSFDGLQLKYLEPISERFPRDYQRILDFFPLADLGFMRYDKICPAI